MGREYTEAQKRATAEYMKNKHTFRVIVTKEEEKQIKNHAKAMGESVNAFINRAIKEIMEIDNADWLVRSEE